jgi:hypothetical protein
VSNIRCRERGVLAEHRGFEVAQLLPGLHAELLHEVPASRPVRREGVRLTSRAVQRKHELPPERLPERVLRDERLQLADEARVATKSEVSLDSKLQCGEPEVVEARGRDVRERFSLNACEHGAAPERERLAKEARSFLRSPRVQRLATEVDHALEHERVDPCAVDAEEVPVLASLQQSVAELAAESRDVHLQGLPRGPRRAGAPELVHETVGRNDLVRVEDEQREQVRRLRPARIDRGPVDEHLEWTEDAERVTGVGHHARNVTDDAAGRLLPRLDAGFAVLQPLPGSLEG